MSSSFKFGEATPGFRILLMDPDQEHSAWISENLVKYEAVELERVEDLASLIARLNRETYDLLLLDLDSTDEKAVRAIRSIKQIRKEQPFILITSRPGYDQVLMALKEGAMDYFVKPLEELSFVRILQNHRYRIHEDRFAALIDSFVTSKRVRMELPSDISLLPHAASRITDEIFAAGAIHSRQIYNLNLALFECLTNALEHGNLNIKYEDKTRRILAGDYLPLIQRMCREEPYRSRKIQVSYSIDIRGVTIQVADEGEGFEAQSLMKRLESQKNQDYHGRGLLLIKKTMDHIRFNDRGNRITIRLRKATDAVFGTGASRTAS